MSLDLPAHAQERLKGLRSSAHSTGVFPSDFSVNEFLLVRKAGFEPIGLCVGSCVYHVGIQYRSWSKNQELDVLSKAMYHARELAMSRMRAEATAMGADRIVGVKLTIKRLEWDEHLLEFIAIGTGVVHGDGHKGFRAHDGGPFTSDLSGQDFWSLLHAGYLPVEMGMGSGGIGRSRWSWVRVSIMSRIAACLPASAVLAEMSSWKTSRPLCTRLVRS